MSMHRLLLMSAAAITLAGCFIHRPDYPTRWAPIEETRDSCASVAGVYATMGEYGPGVTWKTEALRSTEISFYLLRQAKVSDRVEITFDTGRVLHVRAIRNDHVIGETSYSEKDATLSCNPSAVKINVFTGFSPGDVVGFGSEATYLLKAIDGSLIVKRSGTLVGLAFMVMPVISSATEWARYPPAP